MSWVNWRQYTGHKGKKETETGTSDEWREGGRGGREGGGGEKRESERENTIIKKRRGREGLGWEG